MVPVLSAVVILVFVTCIAAVFAVHLFSATDDWNFGPPLETHQTLLTVLI